MYVQSGCKVIVRLHNQDLLTGVILDQFLSSQSRGDSSAVRSLTIPLVSCQDPLGEEGC